jgi:hypothetical protein
LPARERQEKDTPDLVQIAIFLDKTQHALVPTSSLRFPVSRSKSACPFSLYFEGKNRKLSLWQAIFYR